jgi:hypothetical protein
VRFVFRSSARRLEAQEAGVVVRSAHRLRLFRLDGGWVCGRGWVRGVNAQPENVQMDSDYWSLYEQLKQEWVEAHPGATPAEYEAAMREICEMLGI